MPKPVCANHKARVRARRRRFLPSVELLERRAMMSVCGVTCSLTDGMLSVEGTAADDSIELRYIASEGDASQAVVQVIGAGDELVGQFPLSAIESLSVNGLAGNDRFEVDSRLPLSVSVQGGEGEDLLTSELLGARGHSHGGAAASRIRSSGIEQLSPVVAPAALAAAAEPALESTAIGTDSSDFVASAANSSSYALPQITADHGTHAAATGETPLVAHAEHAAAGGASVVAALAVGGQVHSHAAFHYISTSAASFDSQVLSDHSPAGHREGESDVAAHHQSNDASHQSDVTAKFAPKRCTVRYTSKDVNRTVAGDRKCDCPQKAAAEEAARQRDAVDEVLATPLALNVAAALVDCLPCQGDSLEGGESAGGVCSLVFPTEEEHLGGACPTRDQVLAAAADLGAAAFYEGLQLVGWTLLGTSLLAIPWNGKRKSKQEPRDDEFEPAADWLFRRLGFESAPR